MLKEAGTVLHKARSGRLIVRLSQSVQPGCYILDEKGRKIGKVIELIGPVKSPYASIAPSTSRLGTKGSRVFVQG